MSETPKRIHLLGEGRYAEAVAGAVLTPGQLVKLSSTGTLILHAVAGGPSEKAFVLEDALQGKTIADAGTATTVTPYILAQPGDVVYAFLDAGESVSPADFLTSAGNGYLQAATGTNAIVGVPLETIDNSDTDAVAVRIRVRIV